MGEKNGEDGGIREGEKSDEEREVEGIYGITLPAAERENRYGAGRGKRFRGDLDWEEVREEVEKDDDF